MHQIYQEIHSQLLNFKTAVPPKGQEKIYAEITNKLVDFEKKVNEYAAYLQDMEKAVREPIDGERFEKDYGLLCNIYDILRQKENVAEKYMTVLLEKK